MVQSQDALIAAKYEAEQLQARLTDLSNQVDLLKKSESEMKGQNTKLSSEAQMLRAEMESKTAELQTLRDQIEAYKKKERMPASAVTVASAIPGSTPPATSVVSASASFSPTVASPASTVIPAEAPASDDSRVLTVNRKFNFIVVNLGLKDGLRMGDKVEVVQGAEPKALAQIEKIYDKFSAATLLTEDKGNPVHEGDTVRKI
jgi:FtsZ-binding cell division protein ZapB